MAANGHEPEHKDEENVYDIPLENNVDYVVKYTSFENAVFLHDSSTNTNSALESEKNVSDYKERYYTNLKESPIIGTLHDITNEVNAEIKKRSHRLSIK